MSDIALKIRIHIWQICGKRVQSEMENNLIGRAFSVTSQSQVAIIKNRIFIEVKGLSNGK